MGVAEVPPMEDIVLLGSAIRNVDASDNFGCMPLGVNPERENLGLAPMMGYIHYDEVMQGLCDVKYNGFMNLRMDMPRVFAKNSPHHEKARVAIMPQELTARLLVWSRHVMEYMLRTYDCLDA
jgi:sugar phosphate isomerase/epimerase